MRRERLRPTYDLNEAKELTAKRKAFISGRARRFIENRYGISDKREFVAGLFSSIEPQNFSKSLELGLAPDTWADVYRNVDHAHELWYIKFRITNLEHAAVNVLSANWEGYIH